VIPVAHASAGPLLDIVVPVDGQPTGFHATDVRGFADALHEVLTLPKEQEYAMRERARRWAVGRFSEREFEKGWEASGWREWVR
jgi:alpha-1,2-mannosyltransferase